MRILAVVSVSAMILAASAVRADDEQEKKISLADCPMAVRATLKKEVADGRLVDIDMREVKGVATYESEVWYGDLEYDIVVRGDGTLLKKRLETDGNDDESDADERDEDNATDQDSDADIAHRTRKPLTERPCGKLQQSSSDRMSGMRKTHQRGGCS